CGLHNCWDTSEQVHSNFLEHTPNREVECIDMNGNTFQRYTDMMTNEGSAFGDHLHIAIHIKCFIGKFPPAFAGINEEVTDASIDINPGIIFCSPGSCAQRVKLFFLFIEMQCKCFEHSCPLMKGHFPEFCAPGFAGIVEHAFKINAFT